MEQRFINILSSMPLFNQIEEEKLEPILQCLQPVIRTYPANDMIALEGEPLYGIGLILSGQAQIVRESATGDRIIMAQLSEGHLFGEVAAYARDPVWPVTVIATKDSEVMFIPTSKLATPCCNACPWHRQLIFNMLEILSEKALSLNKKIGYLTLKGMRSRISAYLLDQHKKNNSLTFDLPVKRTEMAELLHVSRPSMSREMGRMRDERIIDFERNRITILDLDSLYMAAES